MQIKTMRKLFKYQKINSFFGKLLSAALSFVMIASITRNLDLEESGKFLSSYSIFLVLLSFATYGLKHEVVKLFSSGISLTEKSKIF